MNALTFERPMFAIVITRKPINGVRHVFAMAGEGAPVALYFKRKDANGFARQIRAEKFRCRIRQVFVKISTEPPQP